MKRPDRATVSQLGVSAGVGALRLDVDRYSLRRKVGGNADPIAITINGVLPLQHLETGRGAYVGAGVGTATTRIRGVNSQVTNGRKTTFAAKAFAGTNFNRRFFGELGYNFIGKARDLNSSGFSLSVGVRF